MTGIIKTKTDKGYGFITPDGEAKDVFFHSKDCIGTPFDQMQVGAKVSFEVVDGQKGPAAANVQLA
jgi:cold shock protein